MFEINPEVHRLKERLIDSFGQVPRGSIIPWSAVAGVLEMPYDDGVAIQAHDKFRAWLLKERGVATRVPPTVGIELLTMREQLLWCSKHRMKKAKRQVRKAEREVGAVTPDAVSLEEAAYRQRFLYEAKRVKKETAVLVKMDERAAAEGSSLSPNVPPPQPNLTAFPSVQTKPSNQAIVDKI